MAFDLNERGNIDSNPLVTFENAIIADAGCLLRLVLARSWDQSRPDKIAVQLTMSAEQAHELAQELAKMVQIIAAAKRGRPN
jgi:hypothetical protein